MTRKKTDLEKFLEPVAKGLKPGELLVYGAETGMKAGTTFEVAGMETGGRSTFGTMPSGEVVTIDNEPEG